MTEPAPQELPARVVLVDDTPDIRMLMRVALEVAGGFEVVAEAGDGASGVDAVVAHRPDLVLLDLALPVMDGFEALPLMQAASPDTQVMVLSGFTREAMEKRALAAGAAAFVQKGTPPDQIVDAARDVLGRSEPPPPASAAEPVPGRSADSEPATSGENPADADQVQRLKRVLDTAAHELRNPATVLRGLAQTLLRHRERLSAQSVDDALDAIVRQTRVLERLTTNLLTSSRADREQLEVDAVEMSLGPVLTAAVMSFNETEIAVTGDAESVVTADEVLVQQMLTNLVSNAIKYGAPPYAIDVTPRSGMVQVTVVDHGPGISPEFEARLFQQYARDAGTGAPGTGLGLYVVDTLARAQRGRAWYERRGGAARFSFSLPSRAMEGMTG